MKEIKLTQGKTAIVDDEDFEEVSKYKWYCHGGYAERVVARDGERQTSVRMHVSIMGGKAGFEIDHINGNPLDNRKENLRHVTGAQNQHNQNARGGGTSKYKGVSWKKTDKRWRSQITIGGKVYCLGSYKSEQDAAYVYNAWAESFFGNCARLNVIPA